MRCKLHITTQNSCCLQEEAFLLTHSFPMHPFSTPLNLTVFWCFQRVEKGCIGNDWVNQNCRPRCATYSLHCRFFLMKQVFYKTVLGDKFWSFIPTVFVCLFWRCLQTFSVPRLSIILAVYKLKSPNSPVIKHHLEGLG